MNELLELFVTKKSISEKELGIIKNTVRQALIKQGVLVLKERNYHLYSDEFKAFCLSLITERWSNAVIGYSHILAVRPTFGPANRIAVINHFQNHGSIGKCGNYVTFDDEEKSKRILYLFYLSVIINGKVPTECNKGKLSLRPLASPEDATIFSVNNLHFDEIDKMFLKAIEKSYDIKKRNILSRILSRLNINQLDKKSIIQYIENINQLKKALDDPELTMILSLLVCLKKARRNPVVAKGTQYDTYQDAINNYDYVQAIKILEQKSSNEKTLVDNIVELLAKKINNECPIEKCHDDKNSKVVTSLLAQKREQNASATLPVHSETSQTQNKLKEEMPKLQKKKKKNDNVCTYSFLPLNLIIDDAQQLRLLVEQINRGNNISIVRINVSIIRNYEYSFLRIKNLNHLMLFYPDYFYCNDVTGGQTIVDNAYIPCIVVKKTKTNLSPEEIFSLKESGEKAFDSEDYLSAINFFLEYLGRLSQIDYDALLLIADSYMALGQPMYAMAFAGFVYYSEPVEAEILTDSEEIYCEACYETAKKIISTHYRDIANDDILANKPAILDTISDIYLIEFYIAFIEFLIERSLVEAAKQMYSKLIEMKPFSKQGFLYDQVKRISEMLEISVSHKRNLFLGPIKNQHKSPLE